MGYFEQYDDCFAYDLVEIVVDMEQQNKGAMLIQLQMVNDERHEHFYGSLGYQSATNLVLKTKML